MALTDQQRAEIIRGSLTPAEWAKLREFLLDTSVVYEQLALAIDADDMARVYKWLRGLASVIDPTIAGGSALIRLVQVCAATDGSDLDTTKLVEDFAKLILARDTKSPAA